MNDHRHELSLALDRLPDRRRPSPPIGQVPARRGAVARTIADQFAEVLTAAGVKRIYGHRSTGDERAFRAAQELYM